jgi:ElaB/YqjD/DUF883 family membrane-anchored ribosome-binding protein
MSASSESNREDLQSTVSQLQREVREAARHLANAGNAAAQKLRDEFGVLREKACGVAEQGRERTVHATQTLDQRIRAEPVKSLLVAAAIGAAFGVWFGRRH